LCSSVWFSDSHLFTAPLPDIGVKEFGTVPTHQIIGNDGTINYRTTGPILSSFSVGCTPSPAMFDYFVPNHNCLILNYNGESGIVELKIPSELIKEFPSIGYARVFFLRSIPFERVSQDDFFTVIQIDLPAGYNQFEAVGGDPLSFVNFTLLAGGFGFIIFILALVIFALASKRISVLKNKRSRKWHDVVNKETRETIRRLYLNYLGAHSIAKELDLDVGIVMDILRGYGIQGREF
jgi:hypothetical protein